MKKTWKIVAGGRRRMLQWCLLRKIEIFTFAPEKPSSSAETKWKVWIQTWARIKLNLSIIPGGWVAQTFVGCSCCRCQLSHSTSHIPAEEQDGFIFMECHYRRSLTHAASSSVQNQKTQICFWTSRTDLTHSHTHIPKFYQQQGTCNGALRDIVPNSKKKTWFRQTDLLERCSGEHLGEISESHSLMRSRLSEELRSLDLNIGMIDLIADAAQLEKKALSLFQLQPEKVFFFFVLFFLTFGCSSIVYLPQKSKCRCHVSSILTPVGNGSTIMIDGSAQVGSHGNGHQGSTLEDQLVLEVQWFLILVKLDWTRLDLLDHLKILSRSPEELWCGWSLVSL